MLQTQLFTKTKRDAPKDETSLNAKLLIKGGFINKEMAGVYSYLPLGLRVINKITKILREEINAIKGQEVLLTTLQDKALWEKTGRWRDDVIDVWFKTALHKGSEVGLATTHEEPITQMMKNHIHSYKDLPVYVYQIQSKFRNELRSKGGIVRGREFLMKDLYSFNKDQKSLDEFYEKCKNAYIAYFDRIGIGDKTYLTFASGGSFSRYSHEFQTVCKNGEDTIYLDKKKNIAINDEVYTEEVLSNLHLKKENLVKLRAVEVGNIFKLGTKYSEALGLTYTSKNGREAPVVMGSYGIGVGRSMGTVVELNNDETGIVWPKSIAPFDVHLISLGKKEDESFIKAKVFYKELESNNIDVLWDDRQDITAGEKFADSDLIGIPVRVVVSEKSLKSGGVEVKMRNKSDSEIISFKKLLAIA